MTVKQGAIPAWSKDPSRAGEGTGTLSLDVDKNGTVTGTASGALGDLRAQGDVEGDELRVRLACEHPEQLKAFNGNVVAVRDGHGAKGHLHAASGNSLMVRDGPVLLKKGGAPPPAPPLPPPPPSASSGDDPPAPLKTAGARSSRASR